MLANFLIPEDVIREDGESQTFDLGTANGKLLLLTLGITRIIEQQSLELSVWGSPDGADWGAKPLGTFPQKFYTGTYQLLVDLADHAEVRHLKAKFKVNRWGHGRAKPMFGFYLFVQETEPRAATA